MNYLCNQASDVTGSDPARAYGAYVGAGREYASVSLAAHSATRPQCCPSLDTCPGDSRSFLNTRHRRLHRQAGSARHI